MNSICVFALLLYVAVCYGAPAEPPKQYTTKYDNINLDEILNSKRLLSNYVKCLADNVGCTPQGKELRGKSTLFLLFFFSIISYK